MLELTNLLVFSVLRLRSVGWGSLFGFESGLLYRRELEPLSRTKAKKGSVTLQNREVGQEVKANLKRPVYAKKTIPESGWA